MSLRQQIPEIGPYSFINDSKESKLNEVTVQDNLFHINQSIYAKYTQAHE